MDQTPNYGFWKPGDNDAADIGVLNENWDKADAVIGQVLSVASAAWERIATYTEAGAFTFVVPAHVYELGVTAVGAGAAGEGAQTFSNNMQYGDTCGASGGMAGQVRNFILKVTPGQIVSGVIGAGGISIPVAPSATSRTRVTTSLAPGGNTTFGGVTAYGGGVIMFSTYGPVHYYFGRAADVFSSSSPLFESDDLPSPTQTLKRPQFLFSGDRQELLTGNPFATMTFMFMLLEIYCPFLTDAIVNSPGGAAAAYVSEGGTIGHTRVQRGSEVLGGPAPDGRAEPLLQGVIPTPIKGIDATGYGSGGGGCARVMRLSNNDSYTIAGGSGASGAVLIFVRKGVS